MNANTQRGYDISPPYELEIDLLGHELRARERGLSFALKEDASTVEHIQPKDT